MFKIDRFLPTPASAHMPRMQIFLSIILALSAVSAAPASTGSTWIRRKVMRVPAGNPRPAPKDPLSLAELAETLPKIAGKARRRASAFDSDEETVCTSPLEKDKRVRFSDESAAAPKETTLDQPVVLSGTPAGVALYQAVLNGDEAAVLGELERGVNVNELIQVQKALTTPLSCFGRVSVTALHAAIKGKHFQILCLLLARGANPNIRGMASNTPFGLALDLELPNEFIIELIEAGAKLDEPDLLSQLRPIEIAMIKSNRRLFLLLLERDAQVNFVNPITGRSLIHQAMYASQFIFLLDLAHLPRLDRTLLSNHKCIYEAFKQGETEIMEMLFYAFGGAFPINQAGWQATSMKPMLYDAILTSRFDAIRLLIQFGAAYVLPEVNFNALELALQCNEPTIMAILASANAEQFAVAVENASFGLGLIAWLVPRGKVAFLDKYIDILESSPRFASQLSGELVKALFFAAECELFELIDYFVEKGVVIHARKPVDEVLSEAECVLEDELSLLELAAKRDSVQLARLLIEKYRFNPNEAASFSGRTALHVAVWNGSNEVLQYLLSIGGNSEAVVYSSTYPPGFFGPRNYAALICLSVSELASGIGNETASAIIQEHKKKQWENSGESI